MIDPRWPYHAISNYDAFGDIPFESKLPADEEDFASRDEATAWLETHGGGVLERWTGRAYEQLATVVPVAADTETAPHC